MLTSYWENLFPVKERLTSNSSLGSNWSHICFNKTENKASLQTRLEEVKASLHNRCRFNNKLKQNWKYLLDFIFLYNLSSSASNLAHFNIFWKSWSTYLSIKYSKKKLMILTVKLGLTSQFLASRVNIIVILIFMKNILASFVFINIQILDYM